MPPLVFQLVCVTLFLHGTGCTPVACNGIDNECANLEATHFLLLQGDLSFQTAERAGKTETSDLNSQIAKYTETEKQSEFHASLSRMSIHSLSLSLSLSLSTWWRSVSLCVASSLCIMALAGLSSSYLKREDPLETDKEDCLKYRPDVDGLRAVAVVAVVTFHLNPSWLPGGWAGVDMFFVVSGYVVTGSLIRSRSISTVDGLASFYTSRVKRLVPNSLCTIFVTALLLCLFIPNNMAEGLNAPLPKIYRSGTYAIFAAANICFGSTHQGYWEKGTTSLEMNPYTHMWSLGVEEQFYLLYPMLLLLLHGQAPTLECLQASPLRSRIALGVCAAMSFVAYFHAAKANSEAAFYYLPFRFWELAVGGWLYEWQASCGDELWVAVTTHKLIHIPLEFCAITLIGAAICIPTMPEQTDLMRMTAGVVGTVCCIIANTSLNGNLRGMLSITPLVSIGKMSYSIYLWHWPVFVLFRWTVGLDSVMCMVAAVFLTVGLASVAYYCIEKPIRQWPCAKWKVLLLLVASVLFCQGGLAVLSRSQFTAVPSLCEEQSKSLNTSFGLPLIQGQTKSRCACELDSPVLHVPPSAVAPKAGASTAPACFPDTSVARDWISRPKADASVRTPHDSPWHDVVLHGPRWKLMHPADTKVFSGLALSAGNPKRTLLVVGDSHADAAFFGVKASQAVRDMYDVKLLKLEMFGFTGPSLDHSLGVTDNFREQVFEDVGITDAFREQVFEEVEKLQTGDVVVLTRRLQINEAKRDFDPDSIRELQRAVVQARNASFILYGDNPGVPAPDLSRCVPTWINPHGCEVTVETIRNRHRAFSDFAKLISNELPRTFYFERWPLYCDAVSCGVYIPGTCILAYRDESHVSEAGGVYASPFMCSFMEENGLL